MKLIYNKTLTAVKRHDFIASKLLFVNPYMVNIYLYMYVVFMKLKFKQDSVI